MINDNMNSPLTHATCEMYRNATNVNSRRNERVFTLKKKKKKKPKLDTESFLSSIRLLWMHEKKRAEKSGTWMVNSAKWHNILPSTWKFQEHALWYFSCYIRFGVRDYVVCVCFFLLRFEWINAKCFDLDSSTNRCTNAATIKFHLKTNWWYYFRIWKFDLFKQQQIRLSLCHGHTWKAYQTVMRMLFKPHLSIVQTHFILCNIRCWLMNIKSTKINSESMLIKRNYESSNSQDPISLQSKQKTKIKRKLCQLHNLHLISSLLPHFGDMFTLHKHGNIFLSCYHLFWHMRHRVHAF